MEYPYLKLLEDIYWVVVGEDYITGIKGYFEIKCELLKEDWQKYLHQFEAEADWGQGEQKLAFEALCGKLLAEDRVVVVTPPDEDRGTSAPQESDEPADCPDCDGEGSLLDLYTFESSDCPSCRGTGIKDFTSEERTEF